jgi:hypothetical protein
LWKGYRHGDGPRVEVRGGGEASLSQPLRPALEELEIHHVNFFSPRDGRDDRRGLGRHEVFSRGPVDAVEAKKVLVHHCRFTSSSIMDQIP